MMFLLLWLLVATAPGTDPKFDCRQLTDIPKDVAVQAEDAGALWFKCTAKDDSFYLALPADAFVFRGCNGRIAVERDQEGHSHFSEQAQGCEIIKRRNCLPDEMDYARPPANSIPCRPE